MKSSTKLLMAVYGAVSSMMLTVPFSGYAGDTIPEILTIDTHVDIPYNFATPMSDAANAGNLQVNLDRMEKGGLNAVFFVVYVDQSYRNDWEYDNAKKSALKKFTAIHRMTEQYPDRVELARTAGDVRRISKKGKRVALIGIENGFVIGQDLKLLKTYYDLGARYMTLVHNGHNDIGDSAQPMDRFGDKKEEHGGLSDFGVEVVKEMNRLGIMVDVSHVSKNTMLAAAKTSNVPVIASHSGVRALVDHPRNMDDEQLEALKKTGGVIQITAVDPFLQDRTAEYYEKVGKIREELGFVEFFMERTADPSLFQTYQKRLRDEVEVKWPRASVKHLVDQIDYVVKNIGIDHVGIASDFDGGGGISGWNDASETPNVTHELIARGYSVEDIKKIWGGNFLRVMREVEKAAGN